MKKFSAIFLVLCMVLSLMPTALAVEPGAAQAAQVGETTYATLGEAIAAAAAGDTVRLLGDITVDCTADSDGAGALNIDKSLILDGNGKTITAGTGFALSGKRGMYHVFNIENGADVTIKNLTIDGAKTTSNAPRSGINLYGAGTLTLEQVTVSNCSTYGLTVNHSAAVVNGLTTSGNGWGGIDVDNKNDGDRSSLTISSATLGETNSVYFEHDAITASISGGSYQHVTVASGKSASVSVTGGTFVSDPSAFVSGNYAVRTLGEGGYEVYYTAPAPSGNWYPSTSTTTVTQPDGSTTTTKTDNLTGTVTSTTTSTNGSSATTVTDKNGQMTGVSASVSTAAAEEAGKTGGSVSLPIEGIAPVTSAGEATAIDVSVPAGAQSVKVEIPVENVTPGTVVVLVAEDGTETVVPTSRVTENGIEVALTGDATIKIVDNAKTFSDVDESSAFRDEIASVSARGIMVGKTEDTFDASGEVTLNQIANVAGRVSGAVTTDDYQGGIDWANGKGLATGNQPATRAQVILALYAAADAPEAADPAMLAQFKDADQIPAELLPAVIWAVENGILKGRADGSLDLGALVTRGQAAALAGRALGCMA